MDDQSRESLEQEIKSAEDVISKLQNFTKDLVNDSGNNILTHLCDGLETFLGFNSTSKGYDGSGIVYSDLDRLCDGVMGFLYQVLKDVSEKQPYSVGKDILENIVRDLKTKLSTGRDGFNVIAQVAQRVREYNNLIKQSNYKVKMPIDKLQRDMKSLENEVSKILENDAVSGTTKKSVQTVTYSEEQVEYAVINIRQWVRQCQHDAKTFNEGFDLAQKLDMQTAVNDLNSKLRNDVLVATKAVKHETQRLEQLTQKEWDDYRYMKKSIRETMLSLNKSVNLVISEQIGRLVTNLKNKVTEINKTLQNIYDKLQDYVNKLQDWIDGATEIRKLADLKVSEVVKKLKGEGDQNQDGDGYKGGVTKAGKELQKKADELRQKAYDAKTQVEQKVKEALQVVGTMNEELKQDLFEVKNRIIGEVSNVKTAIGKLHGVVTTGNAGTGDKHQTIKDVIGHIQEQVMEINGSKGLQGIKQRVEQYVADFNKHFKGSGESPDNSTISGWVEEIWVSDTVESQFIWTDWGVAKIAVKNAIIAEIKNIASKIIGGMPAVERGSVKNTFENVKVYLNGFSLQTASEAERININQFVEKVKKNGLTSFKNSADKHFQAVAEVVLKYVSSAAKNLSTEIDKLLLMPDPKNDSIGKYLENALRLAALLDAYLTKVLRDNRTNHAENVDVSIEQVKNMAMQQIGDNEGRSTDKVDLKKVRNSFLRYSKQIDQTQLTVLQEGKIESITGVRGNNKVPHAISYIYTTLNERNHLQQVDDTAEINPNKFNKKTFADLYGTVESRLNFFTEKVRHLVKSEPEESDKTSIHAYLEDLNRMLQTGDTFNLHAKYETQHSVQGLQKIHDDLLTLLGAFVAKTLNLADELLTSVEIEKTKTIESIYGTVDNEAKMALSTLTTAARRNYVTSVKQLLTAFAEKVEKELAPLPAEIERDLTIGFKGLMGKMEKQFIAHTKTIRDITTYNSGIDPSQLTEMKRAALAVKMGFQDFIFNLWKQEDVKIDHKQIEKDSDDLMNLLDGIRSSQHFDHVFVSNLRRFEAAVNSFSPETMKDDRKILLMPVKHGLKRFSEELKKAYVNTYSCQAFDTALTEYAGQLVTPSSGPHEVYKLTGEGRRAAKIFLTLFNTIYEDIVRLQNKCGDNWGTKKLCKIDGGEDNALGLFLQRCGYEVASDENSKEAELRFPSTGHTGAMILAKLLKPITGTRDNKHLQQCKDKADEQVEEKTQPAVQQTHFKLSNILDCILRHSDKYNEVCHMSTFTARRVPCSVYEMLVWCSGLTYNVACSEMLREGVVSLLEDPNKPIGVDDDGLYSFELEACYLDTYPNSTTYTDIETVVADICSISYGILCTIAGTGDAETIYASDYCNNSFKFKYPTSAEECLDMFLDILRRLFPPLKFLQMQCSLSELYNGWRKCYYGRDVSSSNLPCKEHSSDKSKCQPNCQAKYEPNCQPKSPLQSFLSDCLSGHLPHVVTSIGCKSECATCPRGKPGMPCITPLGFRGFSGATRKGRDICDVLDRWFKITNFRSLFCLVLKTPKSLPEHFGFALSLASSLNAKKNKYDDSIKTVGDKFKAAMQNVSMKLYEDTSKLVTAVTDAYGSELSNHVKCEDHHLVSLTRYGTCDKEGTYSAPFLYSLSTDYCDYRRKKHAGTYLSWAVYLPWNLWNYLRSLYDEFGDIVCKNWGCRSCLNSDTCKPGEHGILDKSCKCSSVVDCGGVSPTLYKYGFVFGNAANLKVHKNTCFQLRTQLMNVLKSSYFTKLFEECDNFLWIIRQPFIWLNVALWLLSLFYLLHIMVIRLDLLHIKSHLHSPSSHRIAAQSLLAAGRVNKLGKVFYLQP